MSTAIAYWLSWAWYIWRSNLYWMGWNLFLAFVPLLLSLWLFRRSAAHRLSRSALWRLPLWWLGLLVFVAFLPNAPYVLTDIIHLFDDIRRIDSVWLITLVVLPQYLLFMLAGFEAYVLSLMRLGQYLRRVGRGRWVLAAELVLHGLSAIGIYLGRFKRFNSWDVITQLDTLTHTVMDDLANKRPLLVIGITFTVVALLYWLFKTVHLALVAYWRASKSGVLGDKVME